MLAGERIAARRNASAGLELAVSETPCSKSSGPLFIDSQLRRVISVIFVAKYVAFVIFLFFVAK
ncbi:MAG TPA: hypothetical protein VGF24_03760 [Vicinamibacterales bacterium]